MQGIQFEHGVWAVVHSTGRKYIGAITGVGWPEDVEEHEAILQALADHEPLAMDPAFELHTGIVPIMTQQGPGLQHIVQVMPIDAAQGPAKVMLIPSAVHLFADMTEEDQDRHKKLVEQLMAQIKVARSAARSNIVLAKTLPGGNHGSS